jgi:uncharacterized protein YkwD
MKHLFAVASLSVLAACGGTSVPIQVSSANSLLTTNTSVAPISTNPNASRDVSFASLLNNVRIENGAGKVTYNARLDAAAQSHSDDMLANNYFSHTGLNGSTAADRARAAGYDFRALGENIASGYQSESGVMRGWTRSPGHHANNINPAFKEFGLGYSAEGTDTRWVLMLGAQK